MQVGLAAAEKHDSISDTHHVQLAAVARGCGLGAQSAAARDGGGRAGSGSRVARNGSTARARIDSTAYSQHA